LDLLPGPTFVPPTSITFPGISTLRAVIHHGTNGAVLAEMFLALIAPFFIH
jgi:hypothetical protein